MSTGRRRTRSERVAALELPPGSFARFVARMRQRDALLRIALCLGAGVAFLAITGAGVPPFPHRTGDIPSRDIHSRLAFDEPNKQATLDAQEQARNQVLNVYDQNPEPLSQLQATLRNTLVEVTTAATLMELRPEVWQQFAVPAADEKEAAGRELEEEQFEKFREGLSGEGKLAQFEKDLTQALAPFEQRGLLDKLPPGHLGDHKEIFVQPIGVPSRRQVVAISDVLIGDTTAIHKALKAQFASEDFANRIFAWLQHRLPTTLSLNEAATEEAREIAVANVPEQKTIYVADQLLAKRGVPLGIEALHVLRLEHQATIRERPLLQTICRSLAILDVIFGLFALSGFYMAYRDHRLLRDFPRLAIVISMAVIAAAMARWLADNAWRAELLPVLLFGMTVAIAYQRELALLLSISVSIVVVLAIGHDLGKFVLLAGVTALSVLLLDSIRSRRKLIRIGMAGGVAAFLLSVGAGVLRERPLGWEPLLDLLAGAGWNALWAVVAGFLITGLLPFIESLFGVLTEISLLELGDVAHPLLQELVRRAPGTYNHSISVASIAEAAAESIGARGLLVRVGAYFHDIGKMLKPGYFVENQGQENSRHDTLAPAMSTLIIIAHIKDGADLARQHKLPEPIIDFIEQHHGTTLVEYFYRRASEQSEANPHAAEVEEDSFRYPGPKPQTKEAGVLMLADAVESASRTLVEPGPSRIEGLVREMAMRRLLDGQFDECGLNLQELRTIQDSLVKSLIAVYHGRVKYPNQRRA